MVSLVSLGGPPSGWVWSGQNLTMCRHFVQGYISRKLHLRGTSHIKLRLKDTSHSSPSSCSKPTPYATLRFKSTLARRILEQINTPRYTPSQNPFISDDYGIISRWAWRQDSLYSTTRLSRSRQPLQPSVKEFGV